MTFVLVILTAAIILAVELSRKSRKTNTVSTAELIDQHPYSYEIIDRYYHPGHTWATVSSTHKVTIGVDDFTTQMIGEVDRAELPEQGQTIHQGEPFAVLHRQGRSITEVAPVSGRVIDVNRRLKHHPGALADSPFGSGWIAKIIPTNLEKDLRNLLKGTVAEGWRETVRMQLIQRMAPNVGTVMQDGGQIVPNLADHLTEEEWNYLVKEFFPIVLSSHTQNNTTN